MSPRLPSLAALAAAVLLSAAACGGDRQIIDPGPGPAPVATVAVAASAPTLAVGQTATVTATLRDAGGGVLTGRTVVWSSSRRDVATVSADGEVTAVAPGTARIAAAREGKEGGVEVTVVAAPPPPPAVASVTLDAESVVLGLGETRPLVATPRDADGRPVPNTAVVWSVTGGAAASVSDAGVVTAREMGIVTVTAAAGGRSARATVTVLGDASHDLVFERWESLNGPMRPALYRLDMRTPDAVAAPVGQTTGGDPAPSPDGARVAFACGTAICVADRDGGNPRVLPGFSETTGPLADQPAWSPDGTRIAFRGWSPGGPPGPFNPADVWVMNADGSNKTRITAAERGATSHAAPAWSPRQPDGSYRIAFSRAVRGADGYERASIVSVRADGADERQVTAPGDRADTEPSWSPDGALVAFVRTGGEAGGDLWAAAAAGGGERPLMSAAVDPPGAQRSPAWSPDGRLVAFVSSHEIVGTYFAWQVYTVRADGTGLARRTDDAYEKAHPAWLRR